MRQHLKPFLHAGVALTIAASALGFVRAHTQTPAASNDISEALKVLDQVTEQNRKLEQENRELMERISTLRQKLSPQPARRSRLPHTPPRRIAANDSAGPPAGEIIPLAGNAQ